MRWSRLITLTGCLDLMPIREYMKVPSSKTSNGHWAFASCTKTPYNVKAFHHTVHIYLQGAQIRVHSQLKSGTICTSLSMGTPAPPVFRWTLSISARPPLGQSRGYAQATGLRPNSKTDPLKAAWAGPDPTA